MLVLAINSGSSSLKCAVIDPRSEKILFSALVDRIGSKTAQFAIHHPVQIPIREVGQVDHEVALELALDQVRERSEIWSQLGGVGHRVVHGGEAFTASALVTEEVISAIERCVPLAPLHNPANLLGIAAARRALPHLEHVAVFDTAFHQTMPPTAFRYAVPGSWYERHRIRRYGFHGTSHRFVSQRAAQILKRPLSELNLITAHLGNGCSAAAIQGGLCLDTTMGFTPLEGLVMGTRSGDIDPALIFHLRRSGLGLANIEKALSRDSGLLGLSQLSNDMRTLSALYDEHPGARLAIDVFCHRLAKYVGALGTSFENLDALVFTGGIGEHSALVRDKVCQRLKIFGLEISPNLNQSHSEVISAKSSESVVLVVPTNEELLIALDTEALVS